MLITLAPLFRWLRHSLHKLWKRKLSAIASTVHGADGQSPCDELLRTKKCSKVKWKNCFVAQIKLNLVGKIFLISIRAYQTSPPKSIRWNKYFWCSGSPNFRSRSLIRHICTLKLQCYHEFKKSGLRGRGSILTVKILFPGNSWYKFNIDTVIII